MKRFIITTLIVAVASISVASESNSVSEFFTQKLACMLDVDPEKSQAGMKDWEEYCFKIGSPEKQSEKKEAIELMKKTLADKTASRAHFWLLHQLARIGDESCVESVIPFLDSADRQIRDEALYVLGNLPGKAVDDFLSRRLDKETDKETKTALLNLVRYRTGRQRIELPTLDDIVKALENADPAASDYVLPKLVFLENTRLSEVPDIENRYTKLEAKRKVLLLDALTKIRDHSALPFAKRSLDDTDESVRLAAIRMLGPLGGVDEMTVLVGMLVNNGRTADTACESLVRLNFENADRHLIEQYEKQDAPQVKSRLIEALNRRRGTIAVPVFEKALSDPDDDVRSAAIDALARNGDVEIVPKLVERFYLENKKEIKNRIFQSLTDSVRYSGERKRAEDLLFDAFQKRTPDEQATLVPLFGKIGGERAKSLIVKRLEDRSDQAAFNALCDWPDASVSGELYRIASDDGDPRAGRAARAYLRTVTLPTGRKGNESVELFKKGLSISKNDDDKKFLLSRLGNFRNMEVLGYLEQYLNDPILGESARRSLLDQCNDFWFHMNNRNRIDPLLEKIVQSSKDGGQVDRAKQFKARRAR